MSQLEFLAPALPELQRAPQDPATVRRSPGSVRLRPPLCRQQLGKSRFAPVRNVTRSGAGYPTLAGARTKSCARGAGVLQQSLQFLRKSRFDGGTMIGGLFIVLFGIRVLPLASIALLAVAALIFLLERRLYARREAMS